MNAPAKTANLLEPRPLYGIGTVARLTGLKPDTLRVWERRYGLGASYKSASGRRLFTQSDLEHLQLITALVEDGVRIGEIASSDRKTLELLVSNRGSRMAKAIPAAKSRVVFIGAELCQWLDGHQGCLSGISAFLSRMPLANAVDALDVNEQADMLVVHCPSVSMTNINALDTLANRLGAKRTLVLYQLCNSRWIEEIERRGMTALEYPPESARLAFELGRVAIDHESKQGEINLGELIQAKPRMYDDSTLNAAAKLKSLLDCECPKHISDLIKTLSEFENYSTACSVENWHEAAVHSCIYAYTAQARYLMEKALQAALEGRGEELTKIMRSTH